MTRPTQTWKSVERSIAKWFPGSKRRGSDYRGEGNKGKTDLIFPGWSIEIKHSKSPKFSLIVSAVNQAETNREDINDIPVAIIHKEGTLYKDSLVVLRLETFAQIFINNNQGDSDDSRER
jgi:hypothetical protein